MQQRLIDADKLEIKFLNIGTVMFPKIRPVIYLEDVENAPTIDAEPVVRCKDCKYHIEHKYSPAFYKCKQVSFLKGRLVSSKFGCVLGTKMDEEQ